MIKIQADISYIARSRPAWTTGDPISEKLKEIVLVLKKFVYICRYTVWEKCVLIFKNKKTEDPFVTLVYLW